ncbi:uncharacterized protein PITG_13647 [Phytophthora infestans T30-4]|uniref:Uncharacterized protein n=1 Tax=Phytophthora infestans (strain T30-4) TaxID=403677 RepID=D0NMG6_PHYIT|nr:uncharacterized protein PITG_13647 [Phytophthora infestans T30-4]EEY60887.1 hypothetical protein PITG_13647 [Phytophthora infestans T30-4]|eukprot:XP_002899833.1 hypothetical protein PITG_13647 [Phytophthora infestans T30-4]
MALSPDNAGLKTCWPTSGKYFTKERLLSPTPKPACINWVALLCTKRNQLCPIDHEMIEIHFQLDLRFRGLCYRQQQKAKCTKVWNVWQCSKPNVWTIMVTAIERAREDVDCQGQYRAVATSAMKKNIKEMDETGTMA